MRNRILRPLVGYFVLHNHGEAFQIERFHWLGRAPAKDQDQGDQLLTKPTLKVTKLPFDRRTTSSNLQTFDISVPNNLHSTLRQDVRHQSYAGRFPANAPHDAPRTRESLRSPPAVLKA